VSTSGITSSLLQQILESPSTANQFTSDLSQLAQDLQSGNLSAAQQDYVTLSQDALNGTGSATANTAASGITPNLLASIGSSSSAADAFTNELNQLGTDLQNGDLGSAQQDLLALDSTALNAASAANGGASSTPAATNAASTNSSDSAVLIQAITQAMEAGDSSTVSSALAQLAAVSSNSAGASALQQASASFAAGAADSSSSNNSILQLLQSLNTNSSGSSGSLLNLLG